MQHTEKDTALKNILGLSQEEAAQVFGITRGQWSMFLSGKRDLPLGVTPKLAVVLKQVQENKSLSKESHAIVKTEQQQLQEKLQQDYRAVQIKQHKIAKQIRTIEKLRTECFAALETAALLDQQEVHQTKSGLIRSIRVRATNTLKKHNRYVLESLQLKKGNLDALKNSLEQKMKDNIYEL